MNRHLEAFGKLYPAEQAFLLERRVEFDFADKMAARIEAGYLLTPGQLGGVQKCVAAAKARAERAAARAQAEATAPAVDVSKIEQAFATAREKGIKRPKLRLDAFKFAPAKTSDAIYVTEGETYLGKVLGGKFLAVPPCTGEQRDRIVAAAADPHAAAVAYGQRTGACAVCGRELVVTESVDLGIGPVCREKMGW